jgi:pimeloyl-ACP methyl ester carboxylesterase
MFSFALDISLEFLTLLLHTWLLSELFFYIIIKYLVKTQLHKLTPPLPYDISPRDLILKILDCNDKLEIYDSQAFISGWFCGAPLRDIKLNNAIEFFAWAMYAKPSQNLSLEEMNELLQVLLIVKERLHLPLEDGYNPHVRHIHMTLEPLHYLHRPLLLYLIIHCKNLFTGIGLRAMGYRKYSFKTISYWYRPTPTPPTSSEVPPHEHETHHPTVFFHGITTGWAPYALLIEYLKDNRTVLLFNLDSIQMNSLNFYMPSPEFYCHCVRSVLDLHGIQRVNLVGHSFGTITVGWFAKCCPSYTAHLTLIDPVSLLLSQPNVAYNFLYRPPVTLMQWLLYLGAASELTIAYALRRNFWWYRNQLWLEDLDPTIGVHVSLAGRDEVCDSSVVREYLMSCAKERQELKELQQRQGQGQWQQQHQQSEGPFTPSAATAAAPSSGPFSSGDGLNHSSSPLSSSSPFSSLPLSPSRASSSGNSNSPPLPIAEITYCYRETDSHAQVLLSAPCLKRLAQEILKGQLNAYWKEESMAAQREEWQGIEYAQ